LPAARQPPYSFVEKATTASELPGQKLRSRG